MEWDGGGKSLPHVLGATSVPPGGLFVPTQGHTELGSSGWFQALLRPRWAEPGKGEVSGEFTDGKGCLGDTEVSPGKGQPKNTGFALIPPHSPAPEIRGFCRWGPLAASEEQDQPREGEMPPSGWNLLPSPLTTTAQQSGEMGFPSLGTHPGLYTPQSSPHHRLCQPFGFDFWLFSN